LECCRGGHGAVGVVDAVVIVVVAGAGAAGKKKSTGWRYNESRGDVAAKPKGERKRKKPNGERM
jgi:hypothetical protein